MSTQTRESISLKVGMECILLRSTSKGTSVFMCATQQSLRVTDKIYLLPGPSAGLSHNASSCTFFLMQTWKVACMTKCAMPTVPPNVISHLNFLKDDKMRMYLFILLYI